MLVLMIGSIGLCSGSEGLGELGGSTVIFMRYIEGTMGCSKD